MRLKLTLVRPPGQPHPAVDLLVTVDTTVTVGELAAAIGERDPLAPLKIPTEGVTLALQDGTKQQPIRHDATVADAGLRSGQTVSVVKRRPVGHDLDVADGPAMLVVVEGPDKGKEFPLPAGVSYIGRHAESTVRLNDAMVSTRHARIVVTDVVEIVDLGSSNGVLVGDEPVARAILGPDDPVLLGESLVRVVRRGGVVGAATAPTVEFNRSPRLDIVYEGQELEGPDVPTPPDKARFSIAAVVAPILMGGVMYLVTKSLFSVLFLAMSPVLMIGSILEQRVLGKKALEEAIALFREALGAIGAELSEANAAEVASRRAEYPAVSEAVSAVSQRNNLLWHRRPDRRAFLEVRLGTARLPSRSTIKLPSRGKALPYLWDELIAVRDAHAFVEPVPAVAGFREHRAIGVAGPRDRALDMARSIVVELAAFHSSSEVVVGAALSGSTTAEWEWLKWLPHVTSDHNPLPGDTVASSPAPLLRLVNDLEDLLEHRAAAATRSGIEGADAGAVPAVIVIVEDDAPIERSRLVELAERGPDHGIHLLWVAGAVSRLPAACGAFIDTAVNEPGAALLGYTTSGTAALRLLVEPLAADAAGTLARQLAPLIDAGARVDDDSDLPRSAALLGVTGAEDAVSPNAVIERWAATNSLPLAAAEVGKARKREHHLRSVIGVAAGRNLVLDLREHGPHALVGGTTGSGKSEFLQTWVMSTRHRPQPGSGHVPLRRLQGRGGVRRLRPLPHCVGLVTDLSPHLVQRALRSLNAELRCREQLLERKRAKDLLELEQRGDPETPPSLVIVVDEFAALVRRSPSSSTAW